MKCRQKRARLGLLGVAVFTAAGLSAAAAQDTPRAAAAPAHGTHSQYTIAAPNSSGGQYYIEFRSRYAWDWGHTYIVHARIGEKITAKNISGLAPMGGNNETLWFIGHFIPVPAVVGATDGDTEEKYVSARFRVTMNKAQYDRVMEHIAELSARSLVWSAPLYNCNAFAADVAGFMGLRVPAGITTYPRAFITNLRKINTGHPEDSLIAEHLKEIASPTRDGRAMTMSGVYSGRTKADVVVEDTKPIQSGTPRVNIGRIRVTNGGSESPATTKPSPQ